MITLRIFKEEDRRQVSAIAAINGYKVWQGKEPRPNSKSVDYVLYIEDMKEEKK